MPRVVLLMDGMNIQASAGIIGASKFVAGRRQIPRREPALYEKSSRRQYQSAQDTQTPDAWPFRMRAATLTSNVTSIIQPKNGAVILNLAPKMPQILNLTLARA